MTDLLRLELCPLVDLLPVEPDEQDLTHLPAVSSDCTIRGLVVLDDDADLVRMGAAVVDEIVQDFLCGPRQLGHPRSDLLVQRANPLLKQSLLLGLQAGQDAVVVSDDEENVLPEDPQGLALAVDAVGVVGDLEAQSLPGAHLGKQLEQELAEPGLNHARPTCMHGNVIEIFVRERITRSMRSELKITAGPRPFSVQFSKMATQNLIMIVSNCTDGQSKFHFWPAKPEVLFAAL